MKKNLKTVFAVLAAGVLFAGCAKETVAPADNVKNVSRNEITLTVNATLPEMEPTTKMSFNPSTSLKVSWDGGETLYVLAGKVVRNAANTADSLITKTFSLTGGTGDNKGVFSGSIDFGTSGLGVEDIKAVALNYNTPSLIFNGNALGISFGFVQTITQAENGILNGTYAAPYSAVTSENIVDNGDNTFSIKNVCLKYMRPVIGLNLYDSSNTYASRKVESVNLFAEYLYGRGFVDLATGESDRVSGLSIYNHLVVKPGSQPTLPSSKENGLKLYYPVRSTADVKLLRAIITFTDDTQVTKFINPGTGLTRSFESGKLYSLSMDFGGTGMTVEYSTDEGATWGTALPAATFSSLAVRTSSTLMLSDLQAIRTAILDHGATAGVALDLSGSNYESATFPSVFGNTDPDSTEEENLLSAIKLPANTTTLADSCFRKCSALSTVDLSNVKNLTIGEHAFYDCTALTSLDFSKIKTINAYAFGNAALEEVDMSNAPSGTTVKGYAFSPTAKTWVDAIKTVKIGKNVKLEAYSFFRLRKLEHLYYNAPSSATASFAWQTTANVTTGYTPTVELTVEMGPDVTSTISTFWCNAGVAKVIMHEGCKLGNNTFGCCRYLKEIKVLSSTTAPTITANSFRVYTGTNASRSTGYLVDADDKKLYVPTGSESLYNEENGGFWYSSVQTGLGYTLTPYTPAP